MEINDIKEDYPEKGLCTLECEMSNEELTLFVEYAFNDILKKQMEIFKHELRSNTVEGNKV